ncbi:hypothetical protein BDK51DRAFT_28936, partial [Blyttiomyces helicus]
RKGNENASRRADLPPSQGGKYAGYGNPNFQPAQSSSSANLLEDPLATLSKGWSLFASGASGVVGVLGTTVVEGAKLAVSGAEMVGQKVSENVIKPTTQAVRDPEFTNNLSGYVSSFGQKITEVSTKGYSYASTLATQTMNGANDRSGEYRAAASDDDGWGSGSGSGGSSSRRDEGPRGTSGGFGSFGSTGAASSSGGRADEDDNWGDWGNAKSGGGSGGGGGSGWSEDEGEHRPAGGSSTSGYGSLTGSSSSLPLGASAGGSKSGVASSSSTGSLTSANARSRGAAKQEDDHWEDF